MTDWMCPNCRGGFPEPEKRTVVAYGDDPDDQESKLVCPWCGQPITGDYEVESPVSITRTVDDRDEYDQGGFLEFLR